MRKRQGKIKRIYKKLRSGFHHYINGTKGVISLFLAILMVPFATIAASLVNAARINSAVAVFDEALCNASNSTLGTYDEFLKKRFGLLAMSQNTASHGSGYTAQDLISETFEFYMEQNLGALSNTYTNFDVSATGVYPLADTDVLLSQVLEAGKYTVPAKLVIDGLSLDDLLSSLTDSLSLASSIFGTLSAGASMADKLSACEEKLTALSTQITASETARTEYDTAYNDFVAAVNAYNALIDEYNQKVSEKQTAVNNATTKVSQCQTALDTEAKKIPDIIQEIENMENEKDANGNKVDNSKKISEYKEAHKDEMAAYNTALENLNTAKSELTSAETALNNVISSYTNKLSEKRTAVTNAKSTYIAKIDNFASELKATGEAVIAAQSSISSAINSGVSLAGNITSTIYEGQKQGVENQIKDMEKNRDAAAERGDNTAKYLWQDKIDAAKEKKTEISNENKIAGAFNSATSIAIDSLETFTTEDYQGLYAEAYGRLIALKSNVQSYVIHTDSTTKLSSATSYYETISQILSAGDVDKLKDNLGQEIANSSFIALVKAVVGFIKAIFTLTAWYDPELCANIDTNNYSSIGGLPSMKDRSDGSQYSLKSEYADVDQQKSEHYKDLLGGYSNNPALAGSATTISNVMDTITNSINTISNLNWDDWTKIFSNLKTIATEIGNIVTSVISFVANLVEIVTGAITQKILLSGYIAYNIPNRTTYTGKALVGAGYSLPTVNSTHQGYAFYAAETEYIIHGSLSETDNQSSLFNTIYLLRLVLNIAGVATNGEVATLAGEAGAATFGIGTVVVYILYFIAEPFVDTLILVNSGSIPIIKTKVYLTPSGIPDLISAFFKLSLTEAQKNSAYQKVIKVASVGQASNQFAENYADAISSGISDPNLNTGGNAFTESWDFDYTKTLILIMTLFTSSDKMLSRLADIVQMEGSYDAVNRIDRYTFNLDQSYTYLRATGTFEANEFIKISNGTGLNSKERVVYRGY